jgi:serine/threonine protein kinase
MSCPDASALQQFVEAAAGSRDDDDALRAHFERCAECRSLVLLLSQRRQETQPLRGRKNTPPQLALDEPQTIGRYELLHRLGEGGMGVVYAAHDPDLGRRVALKLLRRAPDDSDGDERAVQARLQREAHAMARLNHANVIIVHDVGTYRDGVFIAMELVEGETLRRWLATPRPWREVLELFLRAGRGLEAAHGAGRGRR